MGQPEDRGMGSDVRDPYEVLGIPRNASPADVKAAFRRLAAQHHPDRHPEDSDAHHRFKEINGAYQILSDEQKRAAYDRFGASAFEAGGMPGAAEYVDLGSLGLDGLFGDLLGAIGIRTGDRGDLRKRISLTFEESVLGCEKRVTYDRVDSCERCSGSGAEPGSRVDRCGACNGRGRVKFHQAMLPFAVERPCSTCRGTGRIPRSVCTVCHARGVCKNQKSLDVTLPPGIEHGATKVIEGAGNRPRADRPAGDLELVIDVVEHPFFRRNGDDIVCSVPITFAQAALGGEIDAPSLTGTIKVRVPPATQTGSVLRVKGKGVPHRFRSGAGDQLVEVALEVPMELTPRARELIEELGRELGEEVQPKQRSFVEKLRSLLG
jgi:molecular chaperone DnaJ